MIFTSLEATPTTRKAPSWATLLEHFYRRAGMRLLPLQRLANDEVPEPYKRLLVHSSDMTPTLENYYGQPLGIRVISRQREGETYLREVVLNLKEDLRPVEYGVIRIFLEHFPAEARRMILDEVRPLGAILEEQAIGHMSWPQVFFRAESDAHLGKWLRLPRPCPLYGRRNLLLDGSRRLLADVMEILAPAGNPLAESN